MLRRFRSFSLLFRVFWLAAISNFTATSDRKGPRCVAECYAMIDLP